MYMYICNKKSKSSSPFFQKKHEQQGLCYKNHYYFDIADPIMLDFLRVCGYVETATRR